MLELKMSGTVGTEIDLKRTQEVRLVVRGMVTGHDFRDHRDRNGDVDATIKRAVLVVDELEEITVVTRRKRPAVKGQTAIAEDGETIVDATTGEVLSSEELAAGLREAGVSAVVVNGDAGADTTLPDDELEDLARDPMVPEPAWNELNLEQKRNVAAMVQKLHRLAEVWTGAGTPTDKEAARSAARRTREALLEEYGIELDTDAAEAAPEEPAEEAPTPVWPDSPPISRTRLLKRRRYLEGRGGLPAEAARARADELAEIDRRLALKDAATA